MGGIDFTFALALGAFLLASWVDAKVGDSRPEAPAKRIGLCLLGVLDQLPPSVEISCDLVEPASARVDLPGAAGHGLLHQALAFGERLPGLLELVPLFRHSLMMPVDPAAEKGTD